MAGPGLLYSLYERRLARELDPNRLPQHVAVMLDGNRRWARTVGASAAHGHRKGADKIEEFLGWAVDAGIQHVTLWLQSTDNLNRDAQEVSDLQEIIASTLESLAADRRWKLNAVGALDLQPPEVAARLRNAVAASHALPGEDRMEVNAAIGYGGRREIVDAVRAHLLEHAEKGDSLRDVAENFDLEDIGEHLYTAGQPDPDLVIRTSGEQRLSGFLLWQSVHSEYYFCETYWPDFRRVDFLRALRNYGQRERRLGR